MCFAGILALIDSLKGEMQAVLTKLKRSADKQKRQGGILKQLSGAKEAFICGLPVYHKLGTAALDAPVTQLARVVSSSLNVCTASSQSRTCCATTGHTEDSAAYLEQCNPCM